jgi:hypothetical protein
VKLIVQRLNDAGIAKFLQWLTEGGTTPAPSEILSEPNYSEPIAELHELDPSLTFATTFRLGKYLNEVVFATPRDPRVLYEDGAMWAWISLALINSLVSKKDRAHKPKGSPLATAHYLQVPPNDSKRHAYKLIARSAWWMARVHGDSAAFVLASTDSPWGEIAEAVIGRQQLSAHKGFISLATKLYLGDDGQVKTGAAGKRTKAARMNPKARGGLGSMRRLALTLNQFGKTYNTRVITPDAMRALLPVEYQRWD